MSGEEENNQQANKITYTSLYLKGLPSSELIKLWCRYRAANDLTRPFNVVGARKEPWLPGKIAIWLDDENRWEFVNNDDQAKMVVFKDENNYQLLADWLNKNS